MSVTSKGSAASTILPVLGILLLSIGGAGVGLLFLPPVQAATLGILIVCAALWATSYVPEYWPAIGLFALITMTQIAPGEVVLSGFTSSTFWLLFSGMVFGAAIQFTGLNHKLAGVLIQLLGKRYRSVIARTTLFGLLLAFLIPSGIGRVVLLIPIAVAVADQLGYVENSKGRYGILLAAAFGTFLPTFSILPANAPNMLLSGMNEALYGASISYWDYLVLHFPVLGLAKAGVIILVILWLFPAPDPDHSVAQERTERPDAKLNAKESSCCLFLSPVLSAGSRIACTTSLRVGLAYWPVRYCYGPMAALPINNV